ncbi:MAG: GIY-YIG nuclease family protein [Candidatus Omnitrophica bacterium]|nr:GIY-YIG nuclease family protein [Candidatus Omnitrophota bacterium]MBU0895402.1 GIY-YIG nuclease family protein [Candidatus Omnitrophota bacterium]MBU1038023.1 GIY-YIG nuclease family protein [Candidatus Omnitrophota bacterium]MBU1808905.1 GIY-YIG nuclease family protein [Candidatus Omnitrophota bacterium]
MYYIYAIFSETHNRIYIGLASDVNVRIEEHNSGRVKSTKHYMPWALFHMEEYPTRLKARNREKRLKTSFGRKYLKEILNHNRPCSSAG